MATLPGNRLGRTSVTRCLGAERDQATKRGSLDMRPVLALDAYLLV